MRFFSKITVFCNLCFLVSVVLWYVEMQNRKLDDSGQVIPLPWLENVLVILGYSAIIINALFLLIYFIFFALKVQVKVPRWIIIFNVILFLAQVYFHFIFK